MIVAPSAQSNLRWGTTGRPPSGGVAPGDAVAALGTSDKISALGDLLSQLGRLAVDDPEVFRRAAATVASTLSSEARDHAVAGGRGAAELAAGFARAGDGGGLPGFGAPPSGYGPAAAYAREQHALDGERGKAALEAALVQALPG